MIMYSKILKYYYFIIKINYFWTDFILLQFEIIFFIIIFYNNLKLNFIKIHKNLN